MIQVIQIFKKHASVQESYYTPEFRSEFHKWNTHERSSCGYKKDEKFVLHIGLERLYSSKKEGLLIIQDAVPYFQTEEIKALTKNVTEKKISPWVLEEQLSNNHTDGQISSFFSTPLEKCFFDIFTLEQSESGILELSLNCQENTDEIGEPIRKNQKLSELKKGLPVRICLNGKSEYADLELAGGKKRRYTELDYIIEYLGEVSSFEFTDWDNASIDKEIPSEFYKTIDLREEL